MIYVKDGKEKVAKTYFDKVNLERAGYKLKTKKKKRGRPPKEVAE